jgi:DNA-binding NarL/FixJ family response regulator
MQPMKRLGSISQPKKRIFLVEDHPVVRQGVKLTISQESDLEVCGETGSALEALRAIPPLQPDLIVVDLFLTEGRGIDLIRDLHQLDPALRMLVFSMNDESIYVERALQAGARGYIVKDEGPQVLISGIRQVLIGALFLSRHVSSLKMRGSVTHPEDPSGPLGKRLTPREWDVFRLMGRGLSSRQIAGQLGMSIKTVASHRASLQAKLQLDNGLALLRFAVAWHHQMKGGNPGR